MFYIILFLFYNIIFFPFQSHLLSYSVSFYCFCLMCERDIYDYIGMMGLVKYFSKSVEEEEGNQKEEGEEVSEKVMELENQLNQQHQQEQEQQQNGVLYVKVMTDEQMEVLKRQISAYASITEQLVQMHKSVSSQHDLTGKHTHPTSISLSILLIVVIMVTSQ